MRIISDTSARVNLLSPLQLLPVILWWLLLSLYPATTLAHDPGLSLVDIVLKDTGVSVQITYAKQDIEQFIQLDKDRKGGISAAEFAQSKTELEQFVSSAIELSSAENSIHAVATDIELDKSDAVHFRLQYLPVSETEFSIHSRMIGQFALGHRQFVKVKTSEGLVSSRILSARDSMFQINLPRTDSWGIFSNFLLEGIWHIWIGFDHILFVITLLLPAVLVFKRGRWYPEDELKQTFKQATLVISAFTVAHSLTLALTVFNVIALPLQAVESIIAASVIVAAVNNIFTWVYGRLWLLAFIFGLVHGMGFAAVLNELGMQTTAQVMTLIAFNLGVELGQLGIIASVLPGLYLLRNQRYYKPVVMQSGSWVIVGIASFWLFERITETNITDYFV